MQPQVSYLQAQPAKSDVELAVNAGCAPTESESSFLRFLESRTKAKTP